MQVQVSLTIEISASASIWEMEEQIQAAGRLAMCQAMKQAIRHWEEQHRTCPYCGETQRRLEGTARCRPFCWSASSVSDLQPETNTGNYLCRGRIKSI